MGEYIVKIVTPYQFTRIKEITGCHPELVRTCRFVPDDSFSIGAVRCNVCGEYWFPENDKSRFIYCPNCRSKVEK